MKKYLKSQVGAASILFTMVMVVIISLLAIGFSVITTNDQKATIDKTISAQAKYAAQSGINSIVEAISNGKITQGQTQSTCSTDPTLIPDLGNIGSAKITCLKWNYKPQSLNYAVSAFTSKIQPDAPVDSLTIRWDISGSPKAFYNSTPSNLTSLNSSNFPVVKIVTANNDTTHQFVTYVFPSSAAPSSTVTYPQPNSDGTAVIQIISTNCSASPPLSCSITIKNFGAWTNASPGLISVSTVVGSVASFEVTGSSGGASVSFSNSQVQIDSTATSQNQVQRLIASYSISGTNGWKPLFVAQSGNAMCKNYKYVGAVSDGGQGPASPYCSNLLN
jgi:hypothetical protein